MAATMLMREYETIYVIRPDLDDNKAAEFMIGKKDLVEKLGGKNLKVTALGRRKLAWETKKESRGIYVHHQFLGKPGIVKDFDRALMIDDAVLIRHSVVVKDNVDPNTAVVGEDMLVPPVFREKREFERRGRDFYSDRFDGGDFDRKSNYDDMDGFDDDN